MEFRLVPNRSEKCSSIPNLISFLVINGFVWLSASREALCILTNNEKKKIVKTKVKKKLKQNCQCIVATRG